MTRRRAFTLVELLVVIAIILLLMGILLPTFAGIDRDRKNMACQHNLAEIGKALNAYATVSGGRYPYPKDHYYGRFFWGPFTGSIWTGDRWASLSHLRLLQQAGLKPESFYCPFSSVYDNMNAWPASTWQKPQVTGSPLENRVYVGYVLLMERPYGQTFTDDRLTVHDIDSPDDVPIVADILHYRSGGGLVSGWDHGGGNPDGVFNSGCNTLFKGGAVVYTDAGEFDWNQPSIIVGSARDLWWFALKP